MSITLLVAKAVELPNKVFCYNFIELFSVHECLCLDIVHIRFCVVKLLSERVQQVKLFILCVLFKCHWSLLLYCRHVLSVKLS